MNLYALPAGLGQFVQHKIADGKCQSVTEVVSAALRLLQAHEAQGHNGCHASGLHRVALTFASRDGDLLGGAHGIAPPRRRMLEAALVEEHQGMHRLVLGRGSDVSVHGEVSQER